MHGHSSLKESTAAPRRRAVTPGDPAPPLPLMQGGPVTAPPGQQKVKIKESPVGLPGNPFSHAGRPCLHPLLHFFRAEAADCCVV